MTDVIVIGAGGHGKVVSEIVKAAGDNFIGFLDDNIKRENVIGTVEDYKKYNAKFVIGIGNNEIRMRLSEELSCKWYTAIHPSAIISPSSILGEGTVVMPNAVINADAKIGKHSIINTCSVIEHDNSVGDYCHISVGAKLGGTVVVGDNTFIGIGAIVKNNIVINENVTVGAGAIVVNNLEQEGIYVGLPAKIM